MKIIKYFIFGFLLFILFHFESLNVGFLKISHIWKGLLLLTFSFFLFNKKIKLYIFFPLIVISTLYLFSFDFIYDPYFAILNFFISLLIPISGLFLFNYKDLNVNYLLMFFSCFIILSFIPYKLGFLDSLNSGYNLDRFGYNFFGILGFFQNPHGASISLAGSLLVVLYFLFFSDYSKKFLLILFLLGLYFLFNTYVRTGILMLIVGSIPMIRIYAFSNILRFAFISFFTIILSFFVFFFALSNDAFVSRFTGNDLYAPEESFEKLGSGRGIIYISSLEIFNESNFIEKVFGLGKINQIKRMQEKTGMSVGSHNGFLDSLLQNGLLGLSLFIYYLFLLWRLVRSNSNLLTRSLFYGLLVMIFVQGFDWFNYNFILFLSLKNAYLTRHE